MDWKLHDSAYREVHFGLILLAAIIGALWIFPESAKAGIACDLYQTSHRTDQKDGHLYDFRSLYTCSRSFDLGARVSTMLDGGGADGTGRRVFEANENDPKKAGERGLTCGNPIVASTGNKVESEIDFTSGGEAGLFLRREYNKLWDGVGIFGKNWLSNFDYRLTFGAATTISSCYPRPGGGACSVGANSIIYAHRPDARTIKFIKHADGTFYEDKASAVAKIVTQANGSFMLYGEDREVERYTPTGYIAEIKDEHGIGWVYTYSGTYPTRVTHTSGRYVDFVWTGSQLTSVRDPAGNYYGYAYLANRFGTGLHLLSATSRPGNPVNTIAYHYEDARFLGALTGKSFSGVRYSWFSYDANGRAISSDHGDGRDRHIFSYSTGEPNEMLVTQTNPLGLKSDYSILNGTIQYHGRTASMYCPAAGKLTTFDANGNENIVRDFNGNSTDYDYNAKGQLLAKTEASGTPLARTTQYTWDAAVNRMLSVTVVGLQRTNYAYNSDNRIQSFTVTNLSVNGVVNQARTTTFTYTKNANGMLSSVTEDGPISGSGDAVTTRYDALGNLLSVENSLGHTAAYGNHNGLGLPGRVTGVNGSITDYVYDAQGRVVLVRRWINGVAADTTYAYDAQGLLATTTTPDGVVTTNEYDTARRITRVWRAANGVVTGGATQEDQLYTYNLNSDVIKVENRRLSGQYQLQCTRWRTNGEGYPECMKEENVWVGTTTVTQSSFADYDELGRVRARRGNNGQNIRYSYDLNGNIKTITDSQSRITTWGYDALDRLIYSVDPVNAPNATWFEYDAGDRVKKVTDPRGKATYYITDGFGSLWARTSPDTGTTTQEFNPAGHMTKSTRNDGSFLTYQYDALGRPVWVGNSAKARAYGYDWCANGKGKLCNADHGNGTRHYGYTKEGQLFQTRDRTPTSDEWVSYSYDNMGRMAGMSYPSGVSVGYGYSQSRLTVMQATVNGVTQNVATGMQYHSFGQLAKLTYGNGVIKERSYDLDGRLTVTHDHGWVGHTQHYNQNDEITAIDNWSRATYSQQFGYDALSRLTSIGSPSGNQSLTYDANGNRTRLIWAADMPYVVDTNSNRLLSEHISYAYDSRGNRASQSLSGSTAVYQYDSFNRLSSVSRNVASTYSSPGNWAATTYPAGVTSYAFNALGQRVSKSGPLGSSRFVYAGQNTMLTEFTNGVWTSYIWMGNEPIAMVRNNQIFFLHGDHLGRPEVVTDSANRSRWVAANYAFDRAVLSDNVGGLNLGLPGQYYDKETGFWYNGFRDYDSRVGQYTQSDPIGLAGGSNTYAYAGGNPLSLTDVLGLTWTYNSATGGLYHNGTYIETGYAGHGAGVNDPSMQSISRVGPLPTGRYTIGPQYYSPNTGRATMALTPAPTNQMYGRSAFRIHGDNSQRNRTASEGCMIFNRDIRDQIANSGDTDLVVEDFSLPNPVTFDFWWTSP